jgi:hypothetical protein
MLLPEQGLIWSIHQKENIHWTDAHMAAAHLRFRLAVALPPSPPLPYHCTRNRGYCSPLQVAALAAMRPPLRRDPLLSHARCRASLCSPPPLLRAEDSARATDRKLCGRLLSRSRRLRFGVLRRGDGDSCALARRSPSELCTTKWRW